MPHSPPASASEDSQEFILQQLNNLYEDIQTLLNDPPLDDPTSLLLQFVDRRLIPSSSSYIRSNAHMKILSNAIFEHPSSMQIFEPAEILHGVVQRVQAFLDPISSASDINSPTQQPIEDADQAIAQRCLEGIYVCLSLIPPLSQNFTHTYPRLLDTDNFLRHLLLILKCHIHHRASLPAVEILNAILGMGELGLDDLREFDEKVVATVLRRVGVTAEMEELEAEEENAGLITFLVLLNDQIHTKNHARLLLPSPILPPLSQNLHLGRTLGASLVFLFNRSSSPSESLRFLHIFESILGDPQTKEFFYTNDLRVLVDVLIRVSRDSREEDTEVLESCLKLLGIVLGETPLQAVNSDNVGNAGFYKAVEVQALLADLIWCSKSSSGSPVLKINGGDDAGSILAADVGTWEKAVVGYAGEGFYEAGGGGCVDEVDEKGNKGLNEGTDDKLKEADD
ncbi:hypothetical protein HDV05_005619 [Chytridiales sp. JEL 0842]|nr:hypothetical protein HDV05_005619 [Chytridiales sp. JEL 0842]